LPAVVEDDDKHRGRRATNRKRTTSPRCSLSPLLTLVSPLLWLLPRAKGNFFLKTSIPKKVFASTIHTIHKVIYLPSLSLQSMHPAIRRLTLHPPTPIASREMMNPLVKAITALLLLTKPTNALAMTTSKKISVTVFSDLA